MAKIFLLLLLVISIILCHSIMFFYSPHLVTNLPSVCRLVENNCTIPISSFGCHVQDQELGKVIGKEAKCGRLFPLYISTPSKGRPLFSWFRSSLNNDFRLWHKSLGHPNTQKLCFMFNSGLLMNKVACSFKDVHLDCPICKLGKRKALPFPTYDEIIKDFFDLIHADVRKPLHLFHTHITNTLLNSLMIPTDLDGFIFDMQSLKYVTLFKNFLPALPINFLKSSKFFLLVPE